MMYYYIDFEASETEKKIISVGCICEDGREFYSLVNTDDPITFRITQITGITQEDVNEAPASKKVFADLFDWCYSEDEARTLFQRQERFDRRYASYEAE